MNQEINKGQVQSKSYLKLLLIILAAVIVLGSGFTYWYVYGSKSVTTTKTSPTPVKSAVTSPGTSPGMTLTPTSGKTATPAPSATQVPTPSSAPTISTSPVLPNFPAPSGWKLETGSFAYYKPHNEPTTYTNFTYYIKNNWICTNYGVPYCSDENGTVLFTIYYAGGDYEWLKEVEGQDFTYQVLGPINTKDINGNALAVEIVTTPTKPEIFGGLDINSSEIQMVQKSLEQK